MATTAPEVGVDEQAVEEFAGRLFELFTGATVTCLVDIGQRTGLFDAAASGPLTSAALADRAGLQERYVREWLGAMVTSGIFEYEPSTASYWLPREHAACLTGTAVENLAPVALLATMLAEHVPAVASAFRAGGGVPYSDFVPEIHDVMDALWRPMFDQLLIPALLPLIPGLADRLTAGAHVADVGCGTGNALLVLADAFPSSSFVGYDIDEEALDRGRAAAAAGNLTNLTFEHADAATLTATRRFDAIFVFNAVHDQAHPAAVLRHIHDALVDDGVFVMDEPRVSGNLEDNVGNPIAAFTYAVSTLHCMTVSLAAGGAGLGATWSEELAVRMLGEAGFADITVHDAPGDPGNAVFVAYRRVA
jgi:SAM-dependent methyltransferase